mmetsp:Transcript_13662/g.36698  ORF Transcript_13662/g.36698 Transcript_13662/m.36698 type:complete len:81 (-) Transcript_13662:120-362(-)
MRAQPVSLSVVVMTCNLTCNSQTSSLTPLVKRAWNFACASDVRFWNSLLLLTLARRRVHAAERTNLWTWSAAYSTKRARR